MATTWSYGPKTVSFGNKRGIIGRLSFSVGTSEDFVTGLRLVESIQLQAVSSGTDNFFNAYRNTTTTTDNAGDALGTVHLENIGNAAYCVIVTGV